MTSRNDRDNGLSDLLGDVLELAPIDPGLVERYERAPEGLTAEERAQVETWLAESPGARDTMRLLERFDPAALAREAAIPEPGPLSDLAAQRATRAAQPGALSRLREALQGWLEAPGGMGWAAAAAGLALAFLWAGGLLGPLSDPQGPGGTQLAEAPATEVPEAPGVVPVPEPTPEPAAPGSSGDPMLAEAPRPPAPTPETPAIAESSSAGERAPEAPAPVPTPVPEPPQPDRQPQPILMAMALPSYSAPTGAASRPRSFSTLRSGGPAARLVALAPEHVAETASPRPTLYWAAPDLSDTPGELRFAIIAADADEPLLERELARPAAPGLIAIPWRDADPALAAGPEYVWSVSLVRDPERPEFDLIASGHVRRRAADLPPLDTLPPSEQPRALAEAGLWYDAFARVQAALVQRPDDASVRAARSALLRQAGLDDVLPVEIDPRP